MKTLFPALALGLTLAFAAPATAGGTIERACLSSDRSAASRTLCACIQNVADATLSNSDQRRGAKFFSDPHSSQEVRQSSRSADEKFWAAWKRFAATAEQHCG